MNDEDLAAHFAADIEPDEDWPDEPDDEPEKVEIPVEAYSFVVGYLSWQRPDEARAAVEAWRRKQAEADETRALGRT